MDIHTRCFRGKRRSPLTWTSSLLLVVSFALTACGGGASVATQTPPIAEAQCDPSDPATSNQCGTVLIGMTDGDGDFLSYSVDVISLELEVLPNSTRIDFAQYADLTEFVSAAIVPPANNADTNVFSAYKIFVYILER
jgi:hypothetical protein